MNARRRSKPIVTDKQKEQIHDLLLTIIGDTLKGKVARLAVAGAVAAGSQYVPEEPPKAPVAAHQAVSK